MSKSTLEKKAVIRGLGFGASFFDAVIKEADQQGLSHEDLYDALAANNGKSEYAVNLVRQIREDKQAQKTSKPIAQPVDYFTSTNELVIEIPALPRPTVEELKRFGMKEIERDDSPTDATAFTLGTVLRAEESIDGGEYERRFPKIGFGYQHLNWLVEHQDEHPAFKALLGKVYVDGTGLVAACEYGRFIPYVFQVVDCFGLRWRLIGDGFLRVGRVGSPAQKQLS